MFRGEFTKATLLSGKFVCAGAIFFRDKFVSGDLVT